MESNEVAKLNSHLNLLREEYVKLQVRLSEVEKDYQVALASQGHLDDDNFVSNLLRSIAELFESELYSDLTVELEDRSIKAHCFVLAARSNQWGVKDLSEASSLDMKDFPADVSHTLLKWVYTDLVEISGKSDSFLLDLLRAASKYQLKPLADRCERALTSSVTVSNCIRLYQTAEQIGALSLKSHCSELISNHWSDFTADDFVSMPASLAFTMFKNKSQHPLHTSIRAKREDVVFLYLVENSSQLPAKLDESDSRGDLPLNLALQSKQRGVAETLVKHGADVNRSDNDGHSLLHRAIQRHDDYSADFLISNGADVSTASRIEKQTPLHLIAALSTLDTDPSTMDAMMKIGRQLLSNGAKVNMQDSDGNTPLHLAISARNQAMFTLLLEQKGLQLEIQNNDGYTVLWLALNALAPGETYNEQSFASELLKTGSSPNAVKGDTGDTLLHLAARSANEQAALFLAQHGGNGSIANQKGETPLHLACHSGLTSLCEELLNLGANPNAQTYPVANGDHQTPDDEMNASRQTPLHVAIQQRHNAIVRIFLDFKSSATLKTGNNLLIIPNFTLKDSQDQTVFGLALWQGFHDIAIELLAGGASINDVNREGMTLLHQAIDKQDASSAIFLLDHHADCNANAGNLSCLQLAIKRHLPSVVDVLCKKGANMNVKDDNNSCPLWDALESGQDEIASILVQHGCDTNMWSEGPDQCQQTLLHRAIDENNEPSACFLIRSLCDINCTRRPGPDGEGGDEARDGQSPLHMCCSWGLEKVVQCLIEHNADVNAQDSEGKTPLHIAIENQHHVIISLLLSNPSLHLMARDRRGLTPFAVAMATKNNKAAQAILDREPTSSEQFDNRGRNFLHLAIQKADIESVLFLIGVHVNVNSRVQDSTQLTPLHLAVSNGLEMIVRNLLLAGASVNDLTPRKQTALHLAAEADHAHICQVLLENGVDFDAIDEDANNALHISVQHGHLASVRVLLMESQINAEKVNMKGQNPLHILGQHGKDNAAAIFDLFIECMPEYPIDRPDPNGNTILLLAYFNGNGALCRAVVRAGVRLGTLNRDGFSIFNTPVATKQLLFKLLDMLSKEPQWTDGDICQECNAKFTIKVRKHHCRHCGRLLCSRCSNKDMPIIKYNITKPVRVCEICFEVLSLGTL